MAQQSGAQAAPLEDPGSIPSNHMVAYNHPHSSSRKSYSLLLTSLGTKHINGTHAYM